MRPVPRKRFGQNFLTDTAVISHIIQAIRPCRNDSLIEIGPGLGALTRPLLQALDHLHVIEIDHDIIAWLHRSLPEQKLTIHAMDALKFDFQDLGNNLRIVGNLPYNISTPLLFHLSHFANQITDMHFMLQKEVVERMVAMPSTPDYGRLSVMLQSCFDMELLFIVPASAFHPVPKVESAIVRMLPLPQVVITADKKPLFARIVADAFSQRRKTLRNTLGHRLSPDDFCALNIDAGLRAENLSVTQFAAIASHLSDSNDER